MNASGEVSYTCIYEWGTDGRFALEIHIWMSTAYMGNRDLGRVEIREKAF